MTAAQFAAAIRQLVGAGVAVACWLGVAAIVLIDD